MRIHYAVSGTNARYVDRRGTVRIQIQETAFLVQLVLRRWFLIFDFGVYQTEPLGSAASCSERAGLLSALCFRCRSRMYCYAVSGANRVFGTDLLKRTVLLPAVSARSEDPSKYEMQVLSSYAPATPCPWLRKPQSFHPVRLLCAEIKYNSTRLQYNLHQECVKAYGSVHTFRGTNTAVLITGYDADTATSSSIKSGYGEMYLVLSWCHDGTKAGINTAVPVRGNVAGRQYNPLYLLLS
eukprot:3906365-Rhodomonas_salina.1